VLILGETGTGKELIARDSVPTHAVECKGSDISGHKGMVYREPYGVTLIICAFNGPLVLSLRPAVAALSVGNP
jgi:aldehyde dehydrogenase (NAD+)